MQVLRVLPGTDGDENLVLPPLYDGNADEARIVFDAHPPPPSMSPTSRAWLAYREGELLAAEGRTDDALDRFEHAVELSESVGSRFVPSVARTSSLATRARAGDVDEALDAFADVLVELRRAGSLTHAVTALRNLIVLLVRAGRDELAAVLLGALSAPAVKSTYGSESVLIDACRAEIEQRHDAGTVRAWFEEGAAHDARWALDHAIGALP